MFDPLPRWIAHRGGGRLAPENSLAGIKLAARLGFRAVEFDVTLTADRTPVLFHDETLERTSNGSGRVCETADSDLFALDLGHGEGIPRFADAAALCIRLGLLANVEIKPAPGDDEITARVVAEMAGRLWAGAEVSPLISSFSQHALTVARDVAPAFPRGLLFGLVPADWPEILERIRAVSVHCAAEALTDETLLEAGERRVPVLAYTVNLKNRANLLFERGVSGIFTDSLDLFSPATTDYNRLQLRG